MVLGMKWVGVNLRISLPGLSWCGLGPDKIVRKTKYGEEMTLSKDRPTAIHKALGRMSKNTVATSGLPNNQDSNGKKAGDASVEKKNADELYLNRLRR
jgi:hypothetical protein